LESSNQLKLAATISEGMMAGARELPIRSTHAPTHHTSRELKQHLTEKKEGETGFKRKERQRTTSNSSLARINVVAFSGVVVGGRVGWQSSWSVVWWW